MDPRELEQGSEAWLQYRLGKVSASRVADVMVRTKTGYGAGRKNYLSELLCQRLTGRAEDNFTNAAMLRGTEMEPVARSVYEMKNSVVAHEVGCFPHPEIDSFIASPDGLVGDDGLIEIKCPNTATHVDFLRTGKIDRRYVLQMLAQMACTGRGWCDFVSFDDRLPEHLSYKCVRVVADTGSIGEMLTEVSSFVKELKELENELSRMEAA